MGNKIKFREIDEVFTCDCNGQWCACLFVTMLDDRVVEMEMVDESLLNITWYYRLWLSLKIFWNAFWNHECRISMMLNRKQHKQFKAFFSTLEDERCYLCNPDYMEGRQRYWKHGHEGSKQCPSTDAKDVKETS